MGAMGIYGINRRLAGKYAITATFRSEFPEFTPKWSAKFAISKKSWENAAPQHMRL
jgi:hypothetical protein